jgi:hypothetical protein
MIGFAVNGGIFAFSDGIGPPSPRLAWRRRRTERGQIFI